VTCGVPWDDSAKTWSTMRAMCAARDPSVSSSYGSCEKGPRDGGHVGLLSFKRGEGEWGLLYSVGGGLELGSSSIPYCPFDKQS